MSYKVLYRKYRPKAFQEVAGQKAIVQTLQNALKANKISHAYLFAGPRGTGKTTMAKLFAKAINCEKGSGQICNKCDNCLSANNNTHPDIIEIDAASNNGVEEVRSLIEKVKFTPIKGKYKVYIIDEVHMMTPGAFNALLKTLEEPPAHVVFILATTEPHKVLPTILSRCQRYDFGKIDENAMADYLMDVLDKEGIAYDSKALSPIVNLADGGMRDALMMLDQVLSYTSNKISEKDVLDLFGIASLEEKINLLIDIANKNASSVLTKANHLLEGGIDIKRLVLSLLDILKDLLIYYTTNEIDLLENLKDKDIKVLEKLFTVNKINQMIDILIKVESDFKIVSNPRSLFEITLLKLMSVDNISIKKDMIEKKDESKKIEEEKVKEAIKEEKVDDVIRPIKIEVKEENQVLSLEGDMYHLDDETIMKIMVNGIKDDRIYLVEKWGVSLKPLSSNLKIGKFVSLLLDATPYIVTKNILILSYDFERLAKKANIKANQKVIASLVEPLVKRKVFVYALCRAEEVRLRKLFLNLRQINKLPAKGDIEIKEN